MVCLRPKGDTTLGAVDFEDHDFDFLRGRDDLARVHVLLGPAHFRNVDQAFDAGFQLNKCAIIGDVGHATHMSAFQRVLGSDQIPRIFLKLLHAQGNTMGFLVDLDDLNLDGLADGKNFRRVVHTAPGHVGHVQQAVYAAKVHKRTVFGDVLDHTIDCLTFGEVANDFGTLFGAGFFEDRTA